MDGYRIGQCGDQALLNGVLAVLKDKARRFRSGPKAVDNFSRGIGSPDEFPASSPIARPMRNLTASPGIIPSDRTATKYEPGLSPRIGKID